MKKLTVIICIAMMVFAGCAKPASQPDSTAQPEPAAPADNKNTEIRLPEEDMSGGEQQISPEAFTEETHETGFLTMWTDLSQPLNADLDGDGAEEALSLLHVNSETGDSYAQIHIENAAGVYRYDITSNEINGAVIPEIAGICDLDPDVEGVQLIFSVDFASLDYQTFVLGFDGQSISVLTEYGYMCRKNADNELVLSNTCFFLGTRSIEKRYALISGFALEDRTMGVRTVSGGMELTLLKDIDADILTDGEYAAGMLAEGSVISITGTDEECEARFIDDAGREGRFFFEWTDEEKTAISINGVHQDELFAGVVYAG